MTKWKKGMLAVCSPDAGLWLSELEQCPEIGPAQDEIIMVEKVMLIRGETYLAFEKFGEVSVFGAKFFQPVTKDGIVDHMADELAKKIDGVLGEIANERERRKERFIESFFKNLRNRR